MIEFLIILGIIILTILSPFLCFLEGWIIGLLIKATIGSIFITGLKLIGLNITLDTIPLLCGTLAIIGSFFKTGLSSSSFKMKKEV